MFRSFDAWGLLVGRALLGIIFIVAGIEKIMGYEGTLTHMSARLPFAEVLLPLAILIELGGGLLILIGWQARFGALAIFLFLIPVTLVYHAFWNFEGKEFTHQLHQFLKNAAIMGGMLYIVLLGVGPLRLGRKG